MLNVKDLFSPLTPSDIIKIKREKKNTFVKNYGCTEKNGFVTATKLGTTNIFFLLLQPKILLQQPNVLLLELNILLL